jgi:hypothetical protein
LPLVATALILGAGFSLRASAQADSVRQTSTRIALPPLILACPCADSARVVALFDTLVTSALHTGHYTVIPPDTVGPVWKSVRDSLGALYDRRTGQFDSAKWYNALRTITKRLDADFLLIRRTAEDPVPYDHGYVYWYGVSGKVYQGEASGTTPVLTFVAALVGADGRPVLCARGGIRPLLVASFWKSTHPVKPEERYRDLSLDSAAVRRVMTAVIERKPNSICT